MPSKSAPPQIEACVQCFPGGVLPPGATSGGCEHGTYPPAVVEAPSPAPSPAPAPGTPPKA